MPPLSPAAVLELNNNSTAGCSCCGATLALLPAAPPRQVRRGLPARGEHHTDAVRAASLDHGHEGSGTARTAALFREAGFHAVWQDHGYVDGDEDAELLALVLARRRGGPAPGIGLPLALEGALLGAAPLDATTPLSSSLLSCKLFLYLCMRPTSRHPCIPRLRPDSPTCLHFLSCLYFPSPFFFFFCPPPPKIETATPRRRRTRTA